MKTKSIFLGDFTTGSGTAITDDIVIITNDDDKMKTDLERICEIAREGGCECAVFNDVFNVGKASEFYIEFFDKNGQYEEVRDIDAVVRPEMLRALHKVWTSHFGFFCSNRSPLFWVAQDIYEYDNREERAGMLFLVFSEDRIEWIIKNIITPIEKAKEDEETIQKLRKEKAESQKIKPGIVRISEVALMGGYPNEVTKDLLEKDFEDIILALAITWNRYFREECPSYTKRNECVEAKDRVQWLIENVVEPFEVRWIKSKIF